MATDRTSTSVPRPIDPIPQGLTTFASGAEEGGTGANSATTSKDTKEPSKSKDINDKYNYLHFHEQLAFFEFQEYELSYNKNNSVKSRLRQHVSYWKSIDASDFILDIIENGYVIPFKETPVRSVSKNNKSAVNNDSFVTQAISELVNSGCVVKTPFIPYIVNPLSVAENSSGKKRLILDLRITNKFIWKEKITFEDHKTALEYFTKNSYCFKFDIQKAFHNIDVCLEHQTYLGFAHNGEYFAFTVLPFGLTSSPYVFTKCMRELVKHWRKNAVQIVMFLDDGWGTNYDKQMCQRDSDFVKNSLISSGFLISDEKSIWTPTQNLEWIGYLWNSSEFSISIPDKRIINLIETIDDIFSKLPNVSARKLAQCTGKIISMQAVVGNVSRLMTKFLYMYIETRSDWDRQMKLCSDDPCIQELHFWKQNARKLNNKKLLANNILPEVVVFSWQPRHIWYKLGIRYIIKIGHLRMWSKVLPSERLKGFRWH